MITGKPFLTEETISKRVRELARKVSEEYKGRDLVVVGLLKGAFMFFSDFVRQIQIPITIDFIIASSYVMTNTTGKVEIHADLREPLRGRHVLLVEDIVDTGVTLNSIRGSVLNRAPDTLKICTLLDKRERREVNVPLDYVGFTVPNFFLVGYGLDFNGHYRNLPYISVFKKSH